jgi:hypothetical protein
MTIDASEERVVFQKRFQSATLDFSGRPIFARYDCCQFVKCNILIDDLTENLAFTASEFQDCNITDLHSDAQRNFIALNNVFKLPLELLQADFDKRLADALAKKQGK